MFYFILLFQMSVFVLSPEDFGSIATTLRKLQLFPLSYQERWEYMALVKPIKNETEDKYTESLINPFVFRLYLANRKAEQYTYWKGEMTEFVIPLFELPNGSILPLRELNEKLGSLSYNIVTNGGNTFLGVKDDEKLERVRFEIKNKIIRGSERK